MIKGCQDVIFNANVLSLTRNAPAGLTVESSTRINITNNTIVDCDGPEILLDKVSLSRVSGCLLNDARKDGPNIKQTGGSSVQVVGNLQDH
jgi:hypothetical protein